MQKSVAQQILGVLQEAWQVRLEKLRGQVSAAAQEMDNLLMLEDYYRRGQKDKSQMERSFGNLGSKLFDISAMSSALKPEHEQRYLSPERSERVHSIIEKLQRAAQMLAHEPPPCEIFAMPDDIPAVFEEFDRHFNRMADVFRALRMANLEVRAQYKLPVHDPFFDDFDWTQLTTREAELCPPYLVHVHARHCDEKLFGQIVELVSQGRPLKIILFRSGITTPLDGGMLRGRAAALKASAEIESLPFVLRKVFFLQISPLAEAFEAQLVSALFSPRPAVISLFVPDSSDVAASTERVRRAVLARAFPYVLYDPDRSLNFVSNFDISANPEPELGWSEHTIRYTSSLGKAAKVDVPLTYADIVVEEQSYQHGFEVLSSRVRDDQALMLPKYLELSSEERQEKQPFVYAVDEHEHLIRVQPSQEIMLEVTERMSLWRTLQALAGIGNPLVDLAVQRVREGLLAEREAALTAQREELQAEMQKRERAAVTAAMKNLAQGLAGSPDKLKIPLGDIAAAAVGKLASETEHKQEQQEDESAPVQEAAGAAPELPWIESEGCTSCGECVAINKRIFEWNNDKRAVIKDAHGGPYRDIVKAAERCPAVVIHPGQPLDPDEPNKEKWIKRAARFQ